jgi:hypothetical protein
MRSISIAIHQPQQQQQQQAWPTTAGLKPLCLLNSSDTHAITLTRTRQLQSLT